MSESARWVRAECIITDIVNGWYNVCCIQEMSVLLDNIAKSTIDVFRQHATMRQDSTSGPSHDSRHRSGYSYMYRWCIKQAVDHYYSKMCQYCIR